MNTNILKNSDIIITPNTIKTKILKQINKLYNIKFMTIEEFTNEFDFKYDEQAIYYLMSKYNIKYAVASNYLKNIKYIDSASNNKLLNELYEIKEELIEKNLLKFNHIFKEYIKTKKVIVYGYTYITKYQLKNLSQLSNLKVEETYTNNYDIKDIYEFTKIEEEVNFVFNKISKLIKNNIDINKIKIAGASDEYQIILDRFSSLYNIPVETENKNNLYKNEIGKYFLENFSNENIVEDLKKKFDLKNEQNIKVINNLIQISNKYVSFNQDEITFSLIKEELKKTKIDIEKNINKIELISLENDLIEDDTYVFLLGFNLNKIPKIYKDDELIPDKIKPSIQESSTELNQMTRNNTIKILKNIKNLTITYKLETPFDSYYPSDLIEELNLNVIKNYNDYKISYSKKYNEILLAESLDNLIKYSVIDSKLEVLYKNYKIDYLTYDNKYNQIDVDTLKHYIKNKLTLSYSTMNDYYKCSFKYYLNNILRLNIFETTFAIYIGNLFHYVLSKSQEENFNFEESYNEYQKENPFKTTEKEIFFIETLKKDLKFIIETINNQKTMSDLDKALFEQAVKIDKTKDIEISFIGFIDKLLYNEKENVAAIVDYKTGPQDISIYNVPYGIGMQLPVYLYLAKSINKDFKIAGFYLQNILNGPFKIDKTKTYETQYKDSLKLNGYSNTNIETLAVFDKTYKDSEIVKSLKMSKDGNFYQYSKVLTEKEIVKLSNIVEEKIDNAIDQILEGKFEINPKKIGKENVGCKFCKYKDICYMTNKDIVELEEIKDKEFLGGE